MSAKPLSQPHRRELLVVLAMTVLGGVIRLWSPNRLGLVHFDEGIYALAGLWPVTPKGFWGIDPTVVAYAPGGYPFLIGLGSFVLGAGDLTPILVSALMGTLTIPLAAWLSWRTFGPTAGALTATFAAFSGFHIAYSRMALTDVSFLFFFLLAIGLGQRFLERPNLLNTIGLGIGVGLAQWFKYHGWLAGAIVALTAVVNAIRDPAERQPKRLAAIWGQGACAAILAFVVFWPWFRFVESHGGYADLLRHHASYMQGFGRWFANFRIQIDQAVFLSGRSERWLINKGVVVFLAMYFLCEDWKKSKPLKDRFVAWVNLAMMAWVADGIIPGAEWWFGFLFIPWMLGWASARVMLVAVAWLLFTILTPLYYPYARLWLPLEALGWLVLGYACSVAVARAEEIAGWSGGPDPSARPRWTSKIQWWFFPWAVLMGLYILLWYSKIGPNEALPALDSSDSLRIACRQVQADLPKDLARLRFLGRPPITFYLATAGVPLAPQPDLNALLKPGSPADWALVDDALLRQEPDHAKAKAKLSEDWEVVRQYPTSLTLATLLDVNPGAAGGKIEPTTFECPLWLLRSRSQGAR